MLLNLGRHKNITVAEINNPHVQNKHVNGLEVKLKLKVKGNQSACGQHGN